MEPSDRREASDVLEDSERPECPESPGCPGDLDDLEESTDPEDCGDAEDSVDAAESEWADSDDRVGSPESGDPVGFVSDSLDGAAAPTGLAADVRASFFAHPLPLNTTAGAETPFLSGPPQTVQVVGPGELIAWITSTRCPPVVQT